MKRLEKSCRTCNYYDYAICPRGKECFGDYSKWVPRLKTKPRFNEPAWWKSLPSYTPELWADIIARFGETMKTQYLELEKYPRGGGGN